MPVALRLSGLQMGTIHCSYALMRPGKRSAPGKISGVYEYLTEMLPREHFLWANGISYCSAPKLLVVTITRFKFSIR